MDATRYPCGQRFTADQLLQEDETALVLWALWRHFQRFRDVEFIKPHFGEQDLAATYRRTAAEVRAGTEAHLWAPALDILNWAAAHALPSGVMAEQVNPYTNAPLSVSPLTWSHGTLVLTVREYITRLSNQTRPHL